MCARMKWPEFKDVLEARRESLDSPPQGHTWGQTLKI